MGRMIHAQFVLSSHGIYGSFPVLADDILTSKVYLGEFEQEG